MTTKKRNKGFSLVEMLVYTAIIAGVGVGLVEIAIPFLRSYGTLSAVQDTAESAEVTLERIVREIRGADAVDVGASVFNSSPGTLVLMTKDENGNDTILTFYASNGRLYIMKDDMSPEPLSRVGVTVGELVFTYTTGTRSDIVGVSLGLEHMVKTATSTQRFQTSAVVRHPQ